MCAVTASGPEIGEPGHGTEEEQGRERDRHGAGNDACEGHALSAGKDAIAGFEYVVSPARQAERHQLVDCIIGGCEQMDIDKVA